MTGADILKARAKLGTKWGLGRPLYMSELGKLLMLRGRDPGATVRDWEREPDALVSGPVAIAVASMLAGHIPVSYRTAISPPR